MSIGSLLQARALIEHPRWRHEADRHLEPVLARAAQPQPTLSTARAFRHARSLSHASARAGVLLRYVRRALAAERLADARALADAIAPQLFRQRAAVEVAHYLLDRDELAAAHRALDAIDHRLLAGERAMLAIELRVRARRGASWWPRSVVLPRCTPAPAWTEHGEPRACAHVRQRMLDIALALRDGYALLRDALAGLAGDRPRRRALVRAFELCGLPLVDALVELRCRAPGEHADSVIAEAIALHAARATLAGPLARGLAGEPCSDADPRSLERALHDEGRALAGDPARRRVLIAASRYSVRSAFTRPHEWPTEVVDVRLRTLQHLGGELGREAIARALATIPTIPALFARGIAALCTLDAERAADLALARDVDLAVLRVVEAHRGLPHGFALAYALARRKLPDVWLRELVRAHGASRELVRWAADHGTPELAPARALDGLSRSVEQVWREPPLAMLARVAEERELLGALRIVAPETVTPRWTLERWRDHLRSVHRRHEAVQLGIVTRAARLLNRPRDVAALASGDLARLGVAPVVEVGELRVRLLDKRRDLLTYLRFADAGPRNCFRSDGFLYARVRELWADPLSVCWHIERRRDDAWQPCGFLCGGFVEVDGTLALACNSLHVRPSSARIAIVRAVVASLAPLRLGGFGVMNRHGGAGPLPQELHWRQLTLTRLRALQRSGAPVTECADDISVRVNQPIEVRGLYYWGYGH